MTASGEQARARIIARARGVRPNPQAARPQFQAAHAFLAGVGMTPCLPDTKIPARRNPKLMYDHACDYTTLALALALAFALALALPLPLPLPLPRPRESRPAT